MGSVFTLTFGGSGATPLVGANFEFGLAVDNKLNAVGFARAGPSVGLGVTAGLQAGVQTGSIGDLLRPTGEGGGLSAVVAVGSFAGGPTLRETPGKPFPS